MPPLLGAATVARALAAPCGRADQRGQAAPALRGRAALALRGRAAGRRTARSPR